MPSAAPPNARAAPAASDDLDNYFNYDAAVDDFLKDLPIDNTAAQNTNAEPSKNLDEEITVKKKRKPNPKLDENLLLSAKGLPALRKVTKSHLKFPGKGHEFTDISRVLNLYQLWLDDLYPKAKFRDALALVEKVGHSKRMQVMRKAWLDETKPHRREGSVDGEAEAEDVVMSGALPEESAGADEANPNRGSNEDDVLFGDAERQQRSQTLGKVNARANDAPDDDELDALLAESDATVQPATSTTQQHRRRGPFEEDSDEDDLDALLAEQPTTTSNRAAPAGEISTNSEKRKESTAEPDFADEEEIMAGMDMW